jgi:hypothetical protein
MVVNEEAGVLCLCKLSALKHKSGSNNNALRYFQLFDILNYIWKVRLSDNIIMYRKLKVI